MKDEFEIDLKNIFLLLIKKLHIISAGTIFCAAFAAAVSFVLITPLYESSVMFYVNNKTASESVSSSDIAASKSLVDSYIVILETRECLEEIIAVSETGFSLAEAEKMISTSAVNNTEFFRVTVSAENPGDAKAIAEAAALVLPERISGIIEGTFAKIVEKPVLATAPSSPDYLKNIAIGAVFGFVLFTGFFVFREIYFPKEKNPAKI